MWFAGAGHSGPFAMVDRSALEIITTPRPQLASARDRYASFPDTAEVPELQAVNGRNRSFTIGALVDIPGPGAQGGVFAHGSRFGGRAPYPTDDPVPFVNKLGRIAEPNMRGHHERPRRECPTLS